MDRVEVARQVAASLHAAAVARGLYPWRPYEFAVAEAHRRDLDVEETAPGAAILCNGRAVYIRADALILHENVGTPFERAFLVAHELGHSALGDALDPGAGHDPDASADAAFEIDPARSAEPPPVGVDRVVDYGRRQRREVQMDLFAREFLLPRSVIRCLHIEEGLSASEIAERTGAPLAVVAQQLLDALLLPTCPAIEEGEATTLPDRPLNPEQAEAARHRGPAFLLESGPGTGKTQTLVGRVHGLLDEGIDPRRILLLTFSNKAAGEMAERIARRHPEAAAAMWIGTFHAFGLDLVRRFYTELGLPRDPRLIDRVEAVELLEEEFPRLGLKHYRDLYDPTQVVTDILAAISRAKDEVVDEDEYATLAGDMLTAAATPEARISAEKAMEVARVYAAYEQLKRRLHRIDFGDLVALPVRLLERDTHVRARLVQTYQHVLVDEYQDVNRASIRLLLALRPHGEDLWAVGDSRQSIYRFRGASSFNMSRFGTKDFDDGVRGLLTLNYRSVPEIVSSFSAFAADMLAGNRPGARGDVTAYGTRGDGEPHSADRVPAGDVPELQTVVQADQLPVALADTIEAMRQAGHAYRDQAVLCTGNERLSDLGQDLARLGVPVLFLGSLFERPEVRDLLALLSLLTDRRAMGLVRTACLPEFAMTMPDVAAVLRHLRTTAAQEAERRASAVPDAPCAWMNDTLNRSAHGSEGIAGVSAAGTSALSALASALAGFDQGSDPWTVLMTILLDRTRIAARLGASFDIGHRIQAIAVWQLLNFLRAQSASPARPIAAVLVRIRRLLRLGDDRELRQLPAAAHGLDAVRLMTVHGAKGLEFEVVHMPGVNADTIPRAASTPACPPPDGMVASSERDALSLFRAGHAEEQECLFYVALSRARDRLCLYAPTRKANGHNRPLSSFVDRLGPALVSRRVTPTRAMSRAPESADIPLVWLSGARFTDTQIALYERCGRRFFYTHVLGLGGRRATTAYMRLHEAVRAVIHDLIEGGLVVGAGADGVRAREPVSGYAAVEEPLDETIERRLARAFVEQELDGHGYAAEYRSLARGMTRYFLTARTGHVPERRDAVTLSFGDDEIVVHADDVLLRSADGVRLIRRVRTGHYRSSEMKDVGAAAFMLAAQRTAPDSLVEFVYLGDEATHTVALSVKELSNRREKLAGFLSDVRAGRFPAAPSVRTCAGCPSLFICGPSPSGELVVGEPPTPGRAAV